MPFRCPQCHTRDSLEIDRIDGISPGSPLRRDLFAGRWLLQRALSAAWRFMMSCARGSGAKRTIGSISVIGSARMQSKKCWQPSDPVPIRIIPTAPALRTPAWGRKMSMAYGVACWR